MIFSIKLFLHKIDSIISIGDLPTTNIIESLFLFRELEGLSSDKIEKA